MFKVISSVYVSPQFFFLDATYYFIVLIGSTCFRHYYAHHQELTTIMLITTFVILFLVCCMLEVNNNNNNNIFIYLLQLGCYLVEVVILHVNKTWNWLLLEYYILQKKITSKNLKILVVLSEQIQLNNKILLIQE